MTLQTKLSALLLCVLVAWQASLTGSDKMTRGCFLQSSPCRQGDNARTLLYLVAAASAVGILLRKD